MKQKHQKEVNDFPLGFAFGNKQFKEMMEKWGLTENDSDKIYSIGNGGFVRKSDSKRMHEIFDRNNKEMQEAMKDKDFAFSAFDYELSNHEYCITYEVDETLESLGLTYQEVRENPMLKDALSRAKKAQEKYM
jgi:hypothetical protein